MLDSQPSIDFNDPLSAQPSFAYSSMEKDLKKQFQNLK